MTPRSTWCTWRRRTPGTLAFVEAGKHVLCEKPFALNAAQARRMVEAALARSVFLMEAMWSRFRFQVAEVHRCLAAGLTESEHMPLDETLAIAGTLDATRAELGVV